MQPIVESFFDPVTGTFTHVLYAEPGGQAAIIDPVLDYDPKSGRTTTTSAPPRRSGRGGCCSPRLPRRGCTRASRR